ncbi:MAG: TIGR04086 family membrane protein [Clostridia bacterium]|nr:TIGR04086 family membrane protein [Clostridia bacterium]
MNGKKSGSRNMESGQRSPYRRFVGGAAAAVILSTALVALAAFLMQKQVLGIESVKWLNPAIKSVSALAAGFIGTKRFPRRGSLWGAVCGIAYIVITTVVFSLLSGGFSLGSGNLIDLAMCAFAGMAGGIIRSAAR